MSKKLVALLVPFLLLVLAAPGSQASPPDAGASAAAKAGTKITLGPLPAKGAFGSIESRLGACEAKRTIRVFRLKGGKRIPIGRTRTRKSGNGYSWFILDRRAASGKVVAVAPATNRCRAAAKREQMQLIRGTIPECPSLKEYCYVSPIRFVHANEPNEPKCIGALGIKQTCLAEVVEGGKPWSGWNFNQVKTTMLRSFPYFAIGGGRDEGHTAYSFEGYLKSLNSERFVVNFARIDEGLWTVPDTSLPTGEPGGPLRLTWVEGAGNSFSMTIEGYMFRR